MHQSSAEKRRWSLPKALWPRLLQAVVVLAAASACRECRCEVVVPWTAMKVAERVAAEELHGEEIVASVCTWLPV